MRDHKEVIVISSGLAAVWRIRAAVPCRKRCVTQQFVAQGERLLQIGRNALDQFGGAEDPDAGAEMQYPSIDRG